MSYDIGISKLVMTKEYDLPLFTGEPWYTMEVIYVERSINYTYNCGPMFRLALGDGGIPQLNYMLGSTAYPILLAGWMHMIADENQDAYIALNPPNKWGDFNGARRIVATLLAWAHEHPTAVFEVW